MGQESKRYDLEERTLQFAKRVNNYVNKLPKTISNKESLIKESNGLMRIFASIIKKSQ
jgi:hypothetical protein